MRMTWKGEDGGPDAIRVGGIVFPAGQAVDVPESFAIGSYMGNPFFALEGTKSADEREVDRKADAVRNAEIDVANAQNDVDNAKSGGEKAAAQKRLDAANKTLSDAKG